MKINIAVCDDEQVMIDELTRMTLDYFRNRGVEARISPFPDAESLLCSSTRFDVLLLDCRLPGVDGVELARRIKEKSPSSEIVFITAYTDYLFESYDVEHLKYILKPVSAEQIDKTFDDWFSSQNERKPLFVMTDMSVPMSDIYYITSEKRNSAVKTARTTLNSTKTLRDFEQILSPGLFMRVSRGIIVCFANIERYNDGHIVMKDGTEIAIARREKTEFVRRWTKYLNSHR